jgi:hypothetical protein
MGVGVDEVEDEVDWSLLIVVVALAIKVVEGGSKSIISSFIDKREFKLLFELNSLFGLSLSGSFFCSVFSIGISGGFTSSCSKTFSIVLSATMLSVGGFDFGKSSNDCLRIEYVEQLEEAESEFLIFNDNFAVIFSPSDEDDAEEEDDSSFFKVEDNFIEHVDSLAFKSSFGTEGSFKLDDKLDDEELDEVDEVVEDRFLSV